MYTILLRFRLSLTFSLQLFMLLFFSIPVLMIAQDISITDFRIPSTKYQKFLSGLSGGWNKTDNNSFSFGSVIHRSNLDQSSNILASLSYDLGDFSEEHSLEISSGVNSRAWYNKSDNDWIDQSDTGSLAQSQKSCKIDITSAVRYSLYLTSNTWHWFVEGSGYYSFIQDKRENEEISSYATYHDLSYDKNIAWNASIGGGIGCGKLRDGSTVFAILRILNKLEEDSLLTRQLTKEEIIKLVDIIARRKEYAQIHDRYVKFLMGDLFSELQKIGVLKSNAPAAYSVERATEVLSEQIEPRLFGWRARLGVQRIYVDVTSANDYSNSNGYRTSYMRSYRDFLQLDFDYGHPISLDLQVNSNFSMSVPRIDYQRKININFTAKGIYQVGERIDATVSGSLSRSQSLSDNSENKFIRSIYYNAGVSFRFFIEDHVNFTIRGSCFKEQWDYYFPTNISTRVRKGPGIDFSVNYRFI